MLLRETRCPVRGSLRPDSANEREPHLRRREGSQLQNGVRCRGLVHPDRRFSGPGPPDGPPTVDTPSGQCPGGNARIADIPSASVGLPTPISQGRIEGLAGECKAGAEHHLEGSNITTAMLARHLQTS